MSNSIGNNVILTLFGESHGSEIGAVLDGMPAGIEVSDEMIASQLSKRRPQDSTETARVEPDDFRVVSGVFNGRTTGAPICIIIENSNVRSGDYQKNLGVARPGHADYVAHLKYGGFEDWRGGGHFSGRITAGIVAVGAIALKALEERGIHIGTHILSCAGVSDIPFGIMKSASCDEPGLPLNGESGRCVSPCPDAFALESIVAEQINCVNERMFPVIDVAAGERMRSAVLEAKAEGDSVGGVVQTAVSGLPAGVGEPWFDSLEGVLSKVLFAIGGIKGVEFGAGFGFASMRGSQANDPWRSDGRGRAYTTTNNNGGVNGGISNGMPVVFNCAVKPTPSISRKQESINFLTGENSELNLVGRHDPAIVRRICIVITSLSAIVLCDMLSRAYGNSFFSPEK